MLPSRPRPLLASCWALLLAAAALAQEAGAPAGPEGAADVRSQTAPVSTRLQSPFLDEVTVRARAPRSAASSDVVRARDMELRPVRSPSDLLRIVPGLVTGNHAGGGKAEQIFLRGFDADHGTDVAIFLDSIPVNLRSHAHGQGYADMHFVIPELVESVEVRKGPYFADLGDFATAGAARFKLRDELDEDLGFVQASGGSFATQRYLVAASPRTEDGRLKALTAVEAYFSDGPFEDEQNLQRYNALFKVTWDLSREVRLTLTGTDFRSRWGASGQVPQREVVNGRLDRFGAIDNTEGGNTERQNAQLTLSWAPSDRSELSVAGWVSRYRLRLWSNFTFFQNDPVLGDGIEQRDTRYLTGAEVAYRHELEPGGVPLLASAGLSWRSDFPHVILATQTRRYRSAKTQDVQIQQTSIAPWAELEARPHEGVRVVLGGRWELLHSRVDDQLDGQTVDGDETDHLPLGKASLILGPAANTELYFDFGTGFHSNDARSIVAQGTGLEHLPLAIGYEVGFRSFLFERLDVAAAFFLLDLESELVLVGDEGVVEPRGRTRRLGGELEVRFRPFDWLALEADVSYTDARFTASGDAVPLAPRFLARLGANVRYELGPGTIELGIQGRFVGDRPAIEDESRDAQSYAVWDLLLRYATERVDLFVRVDNIFDKRWRETQFFFASQLQTEAAPVDDIHFTPGNPIGVEGGVRVKF